MSITMYITILNNMFIGYKKISTHIFCEYVNNEKQ